MIEITENDKQKIRHHGWVSVSLNVSNQTLDDCAKSILIMRKKCYDFWPYRRIYYDYLEPKTRNIAAVEIPFHRSIVQKPIIDLFSQIKLGKAVNDLTNWNDNFMPLCRIFTMNNKKYKGHFHRDTNELPNLKPTSIQVALFNEDQPGFRIFKKKYDIGGEKAIIDKSINEALLDKKFHKLRNNCILDVNTKYYHNINAKKGTVLFFDPRLLHQGYSMKRRLDFHMRFTKLSDKNSSEPLIRNYFHDFKTTETYNYNAELEKMNLEHIPFSIEKRSFLNAFAKSLNYYLPIRNIKNYLMVDKKQSVPKNFKIDILANSFFQK